MNVLSLFAGIGGIELGLERAGMTTVGQVDIDPFCRRLLAQHWPGVPQHDDIRSASEWWASEPRPFVDVVCGGFPCQPFSNAGFQRGLDDERWMWPEMVNACPPLLCEGSISSNDVSAQEVFVMEAAPARMAKPLSASHHRIALDAPLK